MRFAALASLLLALPAFAQVDRTSFQISPGYSPQLDIQSDMAIVYGVNDSFAERLRSWQEQGYTPAMMTGISWGDYGDYYGDGEAFKRDEVQQDRQGKLFMHGNSTNVGYNVPTPAYVEYIKTKVAQAVEAGATAVFLEEPEYWARTGWSPAFQAEWQRFYGEPWQAPDSSVDAQYRASRLKYELYFRALREVFAQAKSTAASLGREVTCHVPTHSLINYAHWRIVSPMSHLMDLEQCDGYIAQVWTGTARTPNVYRGEHKERTFEVAYFEYGQMLAMVRPSGRRVWFLHDPIEDNPNYSWANYRKNYLDTVAASLFWPEVHHYEVMPWPNRIFQGSYPKVDLDARSGEREGIPADYATQILIVCEALNHMQQEEVTWDAGTAGVGILVSDTMMFQRANPKPSDPDLGSFYGLAMPLLKQGIPLAPVQLEHVTVPEALAPYKVLLLTYEGQKPLKPEYHAALEAWVRAGGCLLYVGDESDPYHAVRAWWNNEGTTSAKAHDDLFARLGVNNAARNEPEPVGQGFVRVLWERPRKLQEYADGAALVVEAVSGLLAARGESMETQHYLQLRRGPYVILSVLDESVSEAPVTLEGRYVNLFESELPVLENPSFAPGQRALLYDLAWAAKQASPATIIGAGARVRDAVAEGGDFRFTLRGPAETSAVVRVYCAQVPSAVLADAETPVEFNWDAPSQTILFRVANRAASVPIRLVGTSAK